MANQFKIQRLSLFICIIVILQGGGFYLPLGGQTIEQPGLVILDTLSASSLVEDIFIRGSCLNVINAKIIGDRRGVSHFVNQTGAISFDEGIFLSTGLPNFASGPNRSSNRGIQLYGAANDKDLDLMPTDSLFDVVGIEFDFVPVDSFVAFRFVFASEEYCEFVGSEFNDVFGFFVSGPGIQGEFSNQAINVARVPGTKDLVSVNTVNHQTNNQYYIQNETRNDAIHCRIIYNPSFLDEIEFDGLTKPLVANFKVIPCETYHIRLVISDVADAILDSGVFLEAKSFNLGGEVIVSTEVNGKDTALVQEGCGESFFIFNRVNPKGDSSDLTFRVRISESSTADPGDDYAVIPDILTIPRGQQALKLPVMTFLDGLSENDEILFLEIEQLCQCSAIQGQISIRNTEPLEVEIQSDTVCRDVIYPLTADISGGVGPYSYTWSNGIRNDTNFITAIQPITMSVEVSDNCNQVNYAENTLEVVAKPTAVLTGTVDLCDVLADHFLQIDLTGSAPWTLETGLDNESPQSHIDVRHPEISIPVHETGTYRLISVSDRYCTGSAAGEVEVRKDPIQVNILDCAFSNSSEIEFIYKGDGPLQVSIDSGGTFHDLGFLKTLAPGKEYTLVTRNQEGCSDWQTVVIPTEVGFRIMIDDLKLKLGHQTRINPELTFPRNIIDSIRWEPDLNLSCSDCLNPVVTAIQSGNYSISILDNFGCAYTAAFNLIVDKVPVYVPNAFTPFNKDGLNDVLEIYTDPVTVKQIALFSIYDRWGNLVFEAADFQPSEQMGMWDGTFSGKLLNPGIFIFRVVVEMKDGSFRTVHGDVALVG